MQDHLPKQVIAATGLSPSALVAALGYGGLLPFAVLAVAVCWPGGDGRDFYAFVLLAYGATIASFLGAIHWGLAMRSVEAQRLAFSWGVAPSLLAWAALLQPTPRGLLLLAVLLLLCYAVDRRLYPRHQLQGWLPMRLRLTLVACASCGAAAWGLLR
jgi:drug/metabolite transporter (DMT)-like permease